MLFCEEILASIYSCSIYINNRIPLISCHFSLKCSLLLVLLVLLVLFLLLESVWCGRVTLSKRLAYDIVKLAQGLKGDRRYPMAPNKVCQGWWNLV